MILVSVEHYSHLRMNLHMILCRCNYVVRHIAMHFRFCYVIICIRHLNAWVYYTTNDATPT